MTIVSTNKSKSMLYRFQINHRFLADHSDGKTISSFYNMDRNLFIKNRINIHVKIADLELIYSTTFIN
jgi:hypothetical protein